MSGRPVPKNAQRQLGKAGSDGAALLNLTHSSPAEKGTTGNGVSPSKPAQSGAATGKSSGDNLNDQPGGNVVSNPLSPSQLGYSGGFSGMFGGNKAETAPFKGEPTRESLTQPPSGYQTPSPNFAYGTGPKESLNKEYNPAAGKYGE